jgi:uncharacterized protein YdeI (YjbR/CyaY-like superfamily)
MSEKNPWNKNNLWEDELEILKAIVNTTQLEEATKWGGIVYTFNNKNIVGLGGFKNYFTIWFFNGVFLRDDLNVLVNANEGVTKSLRQWRFTSKEEIDEKQILKYINEAIENEKLGKSIPIEKKEKIVSEFLDHQLSLNLDLKTAFEKFTASKQNEFLEYIESAKQEKTKITRFEKIKPMILENIGLNDKYRK